MSNNGNPIGDIFAIAARARRDQLQHAFVTQFGPVVKAGPFAGMTLPNRSSWLDGDMLPKLLGCYESELHDAIRTAIADRPDTIVNVGMAEGYYAVGLARLLPDVPVHGFDIDPRAQEVALEAARLNAVDQQMNIGGRCEPETLENLLATAQRPVVVCDCEGYEKTIIDPARVPALSKASLLIECHDFADPAITPTLTARLSPTHELHEVRESGRNPNEHPMLRNLGSLDRWMAICEFRPCTMHWLIALPKRR